MMNEMHRTGGEAMQRNPMLLPAESGFVPAEMPGLRVREEVRKRLAEHGRVIADP